MTTTKKRVATRKTTRTSSSVGAAERFRQVNLIADPLYGYIEITKDRPGEASERQLLDTVWLQRLRRVHQLQSAWWVFPSAEHSRFTHLLGAMHLASLFAQRVDGSLRVAFPDAPSPALVEETSGSLASSMTSAMVHSGTSSTTRFSNSGTSITR